MAFALEFQLDRVPSLVAALAMLFLAATLLTLDAGRRLHRAFALYLFLRALFVGLLAFNGAFDELAGRVRVYAIIAVPFAALHFAFAYRRRAGPPTRAQRMIPYALLAAALAFEALYALDHALFATRQRLGPLVLFLAAAHATFVFVAFLFAREYARAQPGPGRRGLYLAAVGFAFEPIYQSTWQFIARTTSLAQDPIQGSALQTDAFLLADHVAWFANFALALGLLVWWALRVIGRADPADARDARRVLIALLFPFTTALIVGGLYIAYVATGRDHFGTAHFAFDALWTMPAPLLVTYALVRHQLFDLDVKVRWTVVRGTIAAAFLAAFFVGVQIAQNFFNQEYNWLWGGMAAGLLVFALTPLQRLAERFANTLMPDARPTRDLPRHQREALYASEVEVAWTDGALRPKQRLLLDRLRERLGISHERAAEVEARILGRARRAA